MLILLIQIIGAILTAFIAVTLLKKDWRTKNEAIRKEALLVTTIIVAITIVSVLNLAISFFQSQGTINQLENDKKELKIANANLSLEISKDAIKQSKLILYYQKESTRQIKLATNNIQHLINSSKEVPLFRFTMLSNKSIGGSIVNKDNKPVYNLSVKITNYDNLLKCKSRKAGTLVVDMKCFINNTIFNPAIASLDAESSYHLQLPQLNNKAKWGRYFVILTLNKRHYYEEAVYTLSKKHGLLQALRVIEYDNNTVIHKSQIKNKDYKLEYINWDKAFPLPLNLQLKKL
ncbi:MAG: hypothetical protein JWQ66_1743 [Mucilaginibacter sp.]|nr:hypothetical protein [Mucilaginibacter sp.]